MGYRQELANRKEECTIRGDRTPRSVSTFMGSGGEAKTEEKVAKRDARAGGVNQR